MTEPGAVSVPVWKAATTEAAHRDRLHGPIAVAHPLQVLDVTLWRSPKEAQKERLERKVEEQRLEIDRLKAQILEGRPAGSKVIAGPVHSGSVPRRIIRQA